MRKRAAAGQSAEASVWLFAKGASQIAHLCVVVPRKDLTYRATGLHFFFPSRTPRHAFVLLSFSLSVPVRLVVPPYFIFLYDIRIKCAYVVIIKSEITSIKRWTCLEHRFVYREYNLVLSLGLVRLFFKTRNFICITEIFPILFLLFAFYFY